MQQRDLAGPRAVDFTARELLLGLQIRCIGAATAALCWFRYSVMASENPNPGTRDKCRVNN